MRPRLLLALLAASCAVAACGAPGSRPSRFRPTSRPLRSGAWPSPRAISFPRSWSTSRAAPGPGPERGGGGGRCRRHLRQGDLRVAEGLHPRAAARRGRQRRRPVRPRGGAHQRASAPSRPARCSRSESAAVAELALNGMRASVHGALRERELNDQACRRDGRLPAVGRADRGRPGRGGGAQRARASARARDRRQGRRPVVSRSSSAICARSLARLRPALRPGTAVPRRV